MTGEELRDWMAEHGYTQRRLAADLGVANSTVTRWRRNGAAQGVWLRLALAGLLSEAGRLTRPS